MKKINGRYLSRLIISTLIFSALIIGVRAEKVPQSGSSKVKILILSKHIRLLKEGRTDSIIITVPETGELNTGTKRIKLRTLSLFSKNKSLLIKADQKSLPVGEYTLYPQDRNDIFSIELNGEKREYPLPLYIKNSGSELELSIEERVDQFAIDSAWGELGDTSEKNSEALYALAHLIKARCALPYLTNKHNGYHFCDLTCCQTYRGRSGKVFNDPVSIRTANLKNGLFFNTSNGGTIFTESIFNAKERSTPVPKEIIYQENFQLSSKNHRNWEASIKHSELTAILYPEKKTFIKKITFDRDKEIIFIDTGSSVEKLSPETFRITVNRVKGWNFIKSNNYSLTGIDGVYKFRGSGLGHGVGMSFEGAFQLAERGYSRYEIIEHYYPEIQYSSPEGEINSRLQYIVFNSESGETIQSSSGTSFRNRIIPCGSVFKLFIALYLAEKRTDLFYNYKYTCKENEKDKLIPAHCWNKSGHGEMDLRSALYNSCNKYFASLYSKIDPDDFTKWIKEFTARQGIVLTVPAIKSKSDFSNLLAGLNFNLTITIDGIIRLNRYIYMEKSENSSGKVGIIFTALHKTFTDGTAKEHDDEVIQQSSLNHISVRHNIRSKELWGKTGTVIAGTNSHYGYGIFTGGLNSTGIVTILKKGTGAIAAKESKKILLELK